MRYVYTTYILWGEHVRRSRGETKGDTRATFPTASMSLIFMRATSRRETRILEILLANVGPQVAR